MSLQSRLWRKHWKVNQELWWYGKSLCGGQREGRGKGGAVEQSHQQASVAPTHSVISEAEYTLAQWGSACWAVDAMLPWDADDRRGQRGRWRRGRQQSTRQRRRIGPGKARGWRQSAGLPEPLTAGLLMPGLLFLALPPVSGLLLVPPQSKSQNSFHGRKAGLPQDRPTRSVHLS